MFFQAELLDMLQPLIPGSAQVLRLFSFEVRKNNNKKKNRDILALSPFPAEGQARKQIKWITLNPD